ncbi:beta-lactamase family protein [Microbacterium sp. SSW1-49]|uniref:Beta-lactamase family protein n=1 Tax=Microbacterium croceum TaxID=2851645 RepID=A0ABT0FCD1_9MICO|nr:serine hydrolase domain-containing protein [Microbacterium croceum]MCK2035720.1 beta-lactamase family protein [Microbacterium croceum]
MANFEQGLEVGSSFAAFKDGKRIVDLAAGVAHPMTLEPYTRDTITLSFSGTKGFVAMCLAILLDRGEIDLNEPVVRYWPEFGQHGKHTITVRDVVTHRSRLPGIDVPVDFDDITHPQHIAAILAAQAPSTDPRAGFCYHALTYGWLCAELVRRVDGRSIGTFFREEVAAPLDAEVWIGLPDDVLPRVSHLIPDPDWITNPALNGERFSVDPLFRSIIGNPPILDPGDYRWNTRALRQAEMPASNGAGTAVGIASLYAGFPHLISLPTLNLVTSPLESGFDETYNSHSTYGVGFSLKDDEPGRPAAVGGYGHAGNGGSVHGYWPASGIAYSYLPNLARKTERAAPILDALSAAL